MTTDKDRKQSKEKSVSSKKEQEVEVKVEALNVSLEFSDKAVETIQENSESKTIKLTKK